MRGRGFCEGADELLALMKMEAKRDIGGALDAVDANFSVALSSVGVGTGKECAGPLDG